MKITYDYYNQVNVNDILLIHNNFYIVTRVYSNDDITSYLELRAFDGSTFLMYVSYKNSNIQASFRNTTVEQIIYSYPELLL